MEEGTTLKPFSVGSPEDTFEPVLKTPEELRPEDFAPDHCAIKVPPVICDKHGDIGCATLSFNFEDEPEDTHICLKCYRDYLVEKVGVCHES